jgi:holo-[acyl-carrier protein] synthase
VSTIGIGVDMVDKKRIATLYDRYGQKFARRILSRNELEDYQNVKDKVSFLAKRFSAKEAISKVLGTGIGQGIRLSELSVDHDIHGKPLAVLSGRALEIMRDRQIDSILISTSDEKEQAISFAVGTRN